MNSKTTLKILIFSLSFFSFVSVIVSIFRFPVKDLGFSAIFLMSAALIVTSRLTLSFPRSKSHLSFSDTMIFLAFLLYGGEVAILLATVEISINCLYLRYIEGFNLDRTIISFNISNTVFSTTIVYFIWLALPYFGFTYQYTNTTDLISTLAILALSQFILQSVGAALYYSLSDNKNFWKTWKNVCFSSSMTQIAGACLAGIIYKLISFADLFTILISFVVLTIAYINYKQMIWNINESIEQAEVAERAKVDIALEQTEAAEAHAGQLEILLEKEEKTSQDLRQSKKDLEYAAFHDKLTDLPNRAYLIERLNLLLQLGVEVSQRYYVLFLDLSRFKNINDSLGHTVGDEVLKVIALRLRRTLRDEDTIARLGGDEFAIILNEMESIDEAKEFARKVYSKLTEPYMIQGNRIFSDLHIGIAPFGNEQMKPEDVLRDADIAMHSAKENNVGIAVFDKEVRFTYLEHLRLEGDLRYAVEKQELEMHYQPLISLKDGELLGFEALLRWHHSELGLISPATFIPISEDSGLIIPITIWILQETCTQLAEWKKISDDYKDLLVSVNISGRHLAEEDLIRDVQNALKVSGLSPEFLKLEITETTAMENADRTIEILNKLKTLGVQISIDDFGTGYSSLSYLHKLPFDTLKIDRSFVNNATEKGEDFNILQTIVSLTKSLNKEIIAEGIETVEQLELLTNLECDYGQGYLFSRPLPKGDIETKLYKMTDWTQHIKKEKAKEIPAIEESNEERLPVQNNGFSSEQRDLLKN